MAFSQENGDVLYAVRKPDGWAIEKVAGERFPAAVALVLDVRGIPHLAFANREGVRLALRETNDWGVQNIATAATRPFGSRVSLALDAEGTPHIAFYELTRSKPLRGVVLYATR